MMVKFVYLLIFFLSQFISVFSSSEDPVVIGQKWTPESLYQHVSNTFLNQNNPRLPKNIEHMIVDPENYLQYADLKDANQYMNLLYENYNISTHVFFISEMKSKFKLDEEIAEFVSKLSYNIYKNYVIYDEKMTLTAVFFIKDRKMRIRTSKNLREVLTDYDCLNILNRRKNDLRNNNFQEVANGLIKDIYNTYKIKLEYKNSDHEYDNYIVLFSILFIIAIAVIYSLLNNEKKTSKQEDKVKVFLDKLKKRSNPKAIFSESCIICLGDFLPIEKIKEIELSGNKENLEKEEISTLECGHKFHRKCIADWLKKEPNCPFCRMKFDIKGDDNINNKQNSGNNINFNTILTEILRIQSDINMLNDREIRRLRNAYNPSSDTSYSSKGGYTSHNKSYSSYNKRSGGATSGW